MTVRHMACCTVVALVVTFALAAAICAQNPPPAAAGAPEPFYDRTEFYGSFRSTEQSFHFTGPTPAGIAPVKLDQDNSQGLGGLRFFSTKCPLPLLDVSYMGASTDTDTTLFPPGPVTLSSTDHDHEFKLGGMLPVPRFGLFKVAVDDTENSDSYGLYAVPQYKGLLGKLGFEWSNNEGAPDDWLAFATGTYPYGPWRFSVGASKRERGYWMAGGEVGRDIGEYFAGAALFGVEHGDAAWAVMLGRPAHEGIRGPSFWAVYMNNPEYSRLNIMAALGKPGIPKDALDNPFQNGIYTAMFTDQMGTVVPIPVRNFEEGRIWMRPDEWGQSGYADWGGLVLSVDSIDASVDYKDFQTGLFYTRQRFGPLLFPHVGPIVESERIPGIGRQDWRYGIEVGTYLGNRPPSKFFQAGRVYIGVSAKTDFDNYDSIFGELRLEL